MNAHWRMGHIPKFIASPRPSKSDELTTSGLCLRANDALCGTLSSFIMETPLDGVRLEAREWSH